MDITGGCYCGELKYEATINSMLVSVCHCRDCQLFSGSAFRTASPIPPADFRITQGQPKLFKKVADSGNTRHAAFCGTCGSHICTFPDDPGAEGAFVSLRWSTADQFERLEPKVEIFCDARAVWLGDIEGATQFSRMLTQ